MLKIKKTIIEPDFSFKDHSKQEMVNQINKDLPISIKYNEDLVNRVYNRYPLINKSEVAIIIKSIFIVIRELLILGKVLSFGDLFFNTQLKFFTFRYKGVIFPSLRVSLITPPKLKDINEK